MGGGKGSDALSGGPGKDGIYAGPSRREGAEDVDAIAAGGGNDAVEARNVPAARDNIDCGGGFDRVLVDGKDLTSGCERKFTSPRKYFNSIFGPNYDYYAPFYL